MAFFSNHSPFFFLLITLLYTLQIHARDSQFFNKIPTTNSSGHGKETKVVTPNKDQEPNFMPENENAHGVYGHESGQLPSSTPTPTPTTNLIPNNKYLPKNYNPVAYVTVPEDTEDSTGGTNNNQYYNSDNMDNHYYRVDSTYDHNNDKNNDQYYNSANTYGHYYRGDSMYDNNDDDNNNHYYNSINTYNDQYHNGGRAAPKVTYSIEPSLIDDSPEYYYNNQEQSSNRYSYDANTEKYDKNPYENSGDTTNSYIADNELSNYNDNFVNYNENGGFQDEENMP